MSKYVQIELDRDTNVGTRKDRALKAFSEELKIYVEITICRDKTVEIEGDDCMSRSS